MDFVESQHRFEHLYILHGCDLDLGAPREHGEGSRPIIVLYQLFHSLMHLLVFSWQTFGIGNLDLSFGARATSLYFLSIQFILLYLFSHFLDGLTGYLFHELFFLLFFLFCLGFCFLSLLVVLDCKVVTLRLDFKEVVRSDLLEPPDNIPCFEPLSSLFPPESGGICALLRCGEFSEDFALILEPLKKVTSQFGLVIQESLLNKL